MMFLAGEGRRGNRAVLPQRGIELVAKAMEALRGAMTPLAHAAFGLLDGLR
ncbi:hypothetical protein L083_7511 [Actinoplanes sp. N902-109]|nr:hypothetical protein L083_7511 [Actinoplanes sp. N902-109]